MAITFKSQIGSLIKKYPLVTLTPEKERQVTSFLFSAMNAYLKENNLSELENIAPWREMKMILCAEAALEIYLGINFINYSMTKFHQYVPSVFLNNQVTLKVFPFGQLPILPKFATKSTVFMIQKEINSFYICGVGDRLVINSLNNPDLVPYTEDKADKKMVFYGFKELLKFKDLKSLEDATTR